jgi:hypothetical protein
MQALAASAAIRRMMISMSPRSKLVVVAALAIAAMVVVTVRLGSSGPPGKLVVAEVVGAAQDDEGYVRIDLRLRNEVGGSVEVVSTEGASFWWGGRRASLESLRILGSIDDGETVDAPFETIGQLPPIPSSEACKVEVDIRFVQEASFLGFGRDGLQSAKLELPVQVSSQPSR